MSRINEIDIFLRKISQLSKTSISLTPDLVYGLLEKYDFSPEEFTKENNLSEYFNYWIEYFRNKKNINVFCHPMQKNFLQFWNGKNNGSEYIKLYISVNKSSLLKSVNEIFTYLEKKNVSQGSKVANKIRSDSIVLRIKDDKDVKEIIDFINKNKYIKNGARKTNPFILREGVVGLAYDNDLSYNAAVAFLISEYINNKKENQDFGNVNCIDFSNYVTDYSRNLITNKDFLNKFMASNYFKNNARRLDTLDESQILGNIKRVFDLIDFNLNENHTYEEFINMYNDSKDKKEELSKDFDKLLIDPYELFINNCVATYKKYGSIQLEGAINKALNGDYSSFTNDHDLRNTMKKKLSKEEIQKCINELILSSEVVFKNNEGQTCANIIGKMCMEETNSKTK